MPPALFALLRRGNEFAVSGAAYHVCIVMGGGVSEGSNRGPHA